MRRIRLTVAYDGTDYCGWQVQNNGATIEGELNTALTQLTGQTVKVIGAKPHRCRCACYGKCGCI